MARICLCLTGKTLAQNMDILEKNRKYADLAELRVDLLNGDERFLIRSFPEMAGIPVVLTIRRDVDGGAFSGGEASRVHLLSRGLAFAEADRRRNFAYVDLEDDLNVPSLEEAARTFGTRIIRSCHDLKGADGDLAAKLRGLLHAGDEIAKLAVTPRSTADLLKIFKAADETKDMEKIFLGMGPEGACTRILAEKLGSMFSYTSSAETGRIAAPGQLEPKDLAGLYRFRGITKNTRVFAVTGFPLKATGSPLIFNTIFGMENSDAVYAAIPSDDIGVFMELADAAGLSGVSVTVPHKETVLRLASRCSREAEAVGACNTIVRGPAGGWEGYNTDTRGFSDSLLAFLAGKKKNLHGRRITIVGAGGAARAAAYECARLGAKVLILNRTASKARDLAARYRFQWGGLDNHGIELVEKFSDVIIQTTPAGMTGYGETDPLKDYSFRGTEAVMDLVYRPPETPFLKRAAAAGCRVLNGFDMLIRQALYQYQEFTGHELPDQIAARVRAALQKAEEKYAAGSDV